MRRAVTTTTTTTRLLALKNALPDPLAPDRWPVVPRGQIVLLSASQGRTPQSIPATRHPSVPAGWESKRPLAAETAARLHANLELRNGRGDRR
jgi:hypothetical protein